MNIPEVDHSSVLRNVRIESPLRDHAPLRLMTWDTGKTYEPWRTRIGVALYRGDESEPLIVSYFGMGMGKTIDGDESLVVALSTVCMRQGDTDAEFFADYTPRALEWAESYECEVLQCDASNAEDDSDESFRMRETMFKDIDHG